jgi:hypothetical protein
MTNDLSQPTKAWATLRDYFGRELEIGRFIIYAGLMGRSAILQIGMIRSLHPDADFGKKKIGVYNSDGRKTGLRYPERVIQVDDDMVDDGEDKRRLLALMATVVAPLVPLSAA